MIEHVWVRMPTIIVLYAAAIVFVFFGSISEYIFVLLAFFFAYHFVKSMNFASFCGSHVTHIFAKNETWQMTWWRQLLHVGCMYVQSMSFVLCLWIKTIIQTGQLDQTIGLSNKYRQTNVSWHVIGCVFWKTRLIRICSHRYGNKLVTQKLWTMTTRFHGKSGADSSFLRYRHCKSCECIQILSWFRERYTWQCKH